MRDKLRKITVLLLVIFAAGISCAEASEDAVIIGVPLPLTGDLKEFGMIMKNSFEMARESVNKAGGINGRPIKIVFADDLGDVDATAYVFSKLVTASKSVMLVGGYASDPTYQMAKKAEKRNVPFLICTASADKITQRRWKNIFRMNPPISEYTKGLEDFWIKNVRPKSMAIIYENSMFGTDGAMRMIEFCRDRAIEIRSHINYDKRMASPAYFRSLVAPLTAEPPDVIYMISYLKDGVELVRQIRDLKIKSLLCGGAGGFTLEEFVQGAGDSANLMLTATLWSGHVRYPGAKEYYTQYAERYGKSPDYHGAEAYSSLLVAADALRRAKSLSPEDIREALGSTYLKTPFGPVKFYSYEDFERQNSISTLVLQIINGKFETIWPLDMSSTHFVSPAGK
ncbi:ABC transporter substrate-binding protein [Desulfobacterales bacterium HSG2]|nr:ABC transporter substrate-binding protein [Desulfobacterales bacterium HSG2]